MSGAVDLVVVEHDLADVAGESCSVAVAPVWIRSTSPADKIGSVDPALLEAFGLDPDVLHLNHGAFGVAPVVVRRAAAAWRERAERNPHRFNRVEIGGLVAAARERAAGFLGVDPSRAAWVRNVSEGVSAVLGSLELHAWR